MDFRSGRLITQWMTANWYHTFVKPKIETIRVRWAWQAHPNTSGWVQAASAHAAAARRRGFHPRPLKYFKKLLQNIEKRFTVASLTVT
jgi:hypothetical protein